MVMLEKPFKKQVSRKFMGAAMTLHMRKRPSPVVVKSRNVLATGLADLKYDCCVPKLRANSRSGVHVMSGNYSFSKIKKMAVRGSVVF